MARGSLPRLAQPGHHYGLLIVLSEAARTRPKFRRVLCQCACGNLTEVNVQELLCGDARSCGCLHVQRAREANLKHGGSNGGLPEYRSWQNMLNRCRTPGLPCYPNYGGRGVRVCEAWRSFENFLADVGPRPTPGHTLERIDVNGDYEPGNCRWATREEQANNKRNNRRLALGNETLTISQWAKRLGWQEATIRRRLNDGWSAEDALTKPVAPWPRRPQKQ